jgi:hypothetical protein
MNVGRVPAGLPMPSQPPQDKLPPASGIDSEHPDRASVTQRRWKVLLAFVLSALFVSAVGFAFDRILLREGVTRLDVLLLSNILTGLVAAAFFLQSKLHSEEKERLLQSRLEKIAEMNHHVRNALQVLAFYAHTAKDPRSASLIDESIHRIEWTLNEVLPRGWKLDRAPRKPSRRSS